MACFLFLNFSHFVQVTFLAEAKNSPMVCAVLVLDSRKLLLCASANTAQTIGELFTQ